MRLQSDVTELNCYTSFTPSSKHRASSTSYGN